MARRKVASASTELAFHSRGHRMGSSRPGSSGIEKVAASQCNVAQAAQMSLSQKLSTQRVVESGDDAVWADSCPVLLFPPRQ